jgi:A/G-specific adenine glycosylase
MVRCRQSAAAPPTLLCRYCANKRDLPWRRQSGRNAAYGVWVSEVMLQQTRVATVVEYWNRWMTKWPSLDALAASNIDDVNAMWSGLGYYRRARMLLEVARLRRPCCSVMLCS